MKKLLFLLLMSVFVLLICSCLPVAQATIKLTVNENLTSTPYPNAEYGVSMSTDDGFIILDGGYYVPDTGSASAMITLNNPLIKGLTDDGGTNSTTIDVGTYDWCVVHDAESGTYAAPLPYTEIYNRYEFEANKTYSIVVGGGVGALTITITEE